MSYGGNGYGQGYRDQRTNGNCGGNSGNNRPPRPAVDTSAMTPEERFNYAKTYKVGFGKHKGRALNEIAVDDLIYLDWMNEQDWLNESCRAALTAFLADPRVAADMAVAKREDEARKAAEPKVKGRY